MMSSVRLERFIAVYPYLYHLTREANLRRVLRSGSLESTRTLIELGGGTYVSGPPRTESKVIVIGEEEVLIRDQSPLLRGGQMRLAAGFSLADLVGLIDRHVFFWPGTAETMRAGLWEADGYSDESVGLLRVRFADLLTVNPNVGPYFSAYNSGAPRMTNGRPSPRGPDLFAGAATFDGTPSKVQEVAFRGSVRLPSTVELSDSAGGPFKCVACGDQRSSPAAPR